jgi:origin recognition complex subunit 2
MHVGFKHNSSAATYLAPKRDDGRTFTAKGLLEFLDNFAIPRLYNTLQDLPTELDMSKEDERWGRSLRDEIIFLKFHKNVGSTKVRGPKSKRKKREAAPAPAVEPHKSSRKSQSKSLTTSDRGAQAYMSKQKSSRNKLEALGDEETYRSVVFPTIDEYAEKAGTYPLIKEVVKIEKAFEEDFAEWRFLLSTNHSLLFYGAGSKRTILNKFADEELKKDGDILVIDGFDKDVTIEGILNLLVDYWLEGVHPTAKLYQVYQPVGQDGFPRAGVSFPRHGDPAVVQKAMAIARALARRATCTSKRRPLYLVLHNIDGIGLRNPTAQEALAGLVLNSSLDNGVNCLRLVASVDHVNGPALLWDSLVGASFRWMWKPIHTYRPYIEEITESKIPEGQTKSAKRKRAEENYTEGSVFSVLLSLAPRHTEALRQLAILQIRMIAKGGEEWVNYIDLMRECQKYMVMNADNQLRIFLKELADQGIVERRDSSGSPMYRIPYATDKLKEIIDYKRDVGTAPNETDTVTKPLL